MPRKPYTVFTKEKHGKTYWCFNVPLVDDENGKRDPKIIWRSEKEIAKKLANAIKERHHLHGINARSFTHKEMLQYSVAMTLLEEANFEEEVTILDAVNSYLIEKEAESKSMLLSEYTEKVIEAQKQKNRSKGHIDRLRNEGKNLQVHFGDVYINKIKGRDCDEYLSEKDVLPVSKDSYKKDISAFFRLAKQWELIKTNPAVNMDSVDVDDAPIVPEDPEYLIKYLREAEEDWLDFYIIKWLAGLRTSEARAVKYEDCHKPRNPESEWTIDLSDEVATKTDFSPRNIEVHQALEEWMEYRDFENKSGFICPYNADEYTRHQYNKKWEAEREQKGMFEGYRRNAHRKTFATYLYALKKEEKGEAWVKEQLGHEPNSKVTKKNYVALRKILKKNSGIPDKALEYFNISPQMVFGEGEKKGEKNTEQKVRSSLNPIKMAEGVGFEPTVELPLHLISNQAP